MASDCLKSEAHHKYVEELISNFLQKEACVQIQSIAKGSPFEENYIDLAKVINMDVEIEE